MEEPTIESVGRARNFWFREGELRVVWKLSIYTCVLACVTVLAWTGLFALPIHIRFEYIGSLGILAGAAAATAICATGIEKRPFSSVGLALTKGWWRAALSGTIISISAIAAVWAVLLAARGTDTSLAVRTFDSMLPMLLSGLALNSIVGFGEELTLRGYIFQAIGRSLGPTVSVLITAVVFAALHMFNPGISWASIFNILLAGILFGQARMSTGSLWLPIGFHTGWNYATGSVFGFPVSGTVQRGVLLSQDRGPAWLTGGSFGPEGGMACTVVLLAGIALLHLYYRSNRAGMPSDREPGTGGAGLRTNSDFQ
jgi:membrane protease YdiL (CAAX protease family)